MVLLLLWCVGQAGSIADPGLPPRSSHIRTPMLEVHEMENARRSNNPRAFKNVRGNTRATNAMLHGGDTHPHLCRLGALLALPRRVSSDRAPGGPLGFQV